VITIVPSSGVRAGKHPLEVALSLVPALAKEYRPLLKKGTATIGHNHADDDGYTVTSKVNDVRVLLIDDTFTSGARVQSAASALQLAGADVVAAVVAARVITPAWNEESKALWERQRALAFDFDSCCLNTHV
jgi:orotate phosphoribosyltransferase